MPRRRPPRVILLPFSDRGRQGEQLTAPQIVAWNAGRKLYRRGLVGYLTDVFEPARHHTWLNRRERFTLGLMGDDEFSYWARQGAASQYVRSLRFVKGK